MSQKKFLQQQSLIYLAEAFKNIISAGKPLENELLFRVRAANPWFEPEQVLIAMESWVKALDGTRSEDWISAEGPYQINAPQKNVGLILAGNIPLVGLHDLLCVLITGQKAIIKPSSKDRVLIRFVAKVILNCQPELKENIIFTDGSLSDADAVIATGSDNSNRYFEYYFRNKPHLFRKNRTSIAVLSGQETPKDLNGLCHDMLDFFGLGCRNVSHILVPESYDFTNLFNALYPFKSVLNNNKYANNYEYNRTLYLLNNEPLLDNNFFLVKQDTSIFSPVSVLHYSVYNSHAEIEEFIEKQVNNIQAIAGNLPGALPFGTLQQPQLSDYADGINTVSFIKSLD